MKRGFCFVIGLFTNFCLYSILVLFQELSWGEFLFAIFPLPHKNVEKPARIGPQV